MAAYAGNWPTPDVGLCLVLDLSFIEAAIPHITCGQWGGAVSGEEKSSHVFQPWMTSNFFFSICSILSRYISISYIMVSGKARMTLRRTSNIFEQVRSS